MPRIFISYVRDNQDAVQRLASELSSRGATVWLDKTDIKPGDRWADSIRDAIVEGDFFVACFSKDYEQRTRSYMNEELLIAIDELRQRPLDQAWFIPVKLTQCEIPARRIGPGETLRDLQWVELFENWADGLNKILSVIRPEDPPIELHSAALNVFRHRLMNSLQGILGSSGRLAHSAKPDDDVKRVAKRLESFALEAALHVRNFQSSIYLNQAPPRLYKSAVDLRAAMETAAAVFQPRMEDEKSNFLLRGLGLLPPSIHADSNMINHLIYVLFDNALKHGLRQRGSSDSQYWVEVDCSSSTDAQAIFTVSNRGKSVDSEALGSVIEQGFFGHPTAKEDPTSDGSGLYIASRIVDLHYGSISFETTAEPSIVTARVHLPVIDPKGDLSKK